MQIWLAVFVSALALGLFGQAHADECSFLPTESAPIVEFTLPSTIRKDYSVALPPLVFEGVTPKKIIRKTVPFGSVPRVLVTEYSSSTPSVTYDAVQGAVVIRGGECVDVASAASSRFAWRSLTSLALYGFASNRGDASSGLTAGALSMILMGLLPFTSAEEDLCLPSVKVVVEVPSGTMNAVEACRADVDDPDSICPEDFPSFPICDNDEPVCGIAVVGAAAGGLYSALR